MSWKKRKEKYAYTEGVTEFEKDYFDLFIQNEFKVGSKINADTITATFFRSPSL